MDLATELAFFMLPLLAAGLLHHFFIIPGNRLAWLARPVDGNVRYRGYRVFGRSKSWRGIAVVVVATSLMTAVLGRFFAVPTAVPHWMTGALIGLGYAIAELPNSFVKRRLGWAEGTNGSGAIGTMSRIADQTDSVVGAILAMLLVYRPSALLILLLFVIGSFIHFLVDVALRRTSYKRLP